MGQLSKTNTEIEDLSMEPFSENFGKKTQTLLCSKIDFSLEDSDRHTDKNYRPMRMPTAFSSLKILESLTKKYLTGFFWFFSFGELLRS